MRDISFQRQENEVTGSRGVIPGNSSGAGGLGSAGRRAGANQGKNYSLAYLNQRSHFR